MKISAIAGMADGPMAEAIVSSVEDSGQGDVWTDIWGPPGAEIKAGFKTELMMPAAELNLGGDGLGWIAPTVAVIAEAVKSPVPIGGQIDLPVARVARQAEECFKACGVPKAIAANAVGLQAVDQTPGQHKIAESSSGKQPVAEVELAGAGPNHGGVDLEILRYRCFERHQPHALLQSG